MLTLLADAASNPMFSLGDLAPFISSLGSTGFAIWFAYYTVTKTLPDQQEENRKSLEKMATAFNEGQRMLIDELKAARSDYEKWKMMVFNPPKSNG